MSESRLRRWVLDAWRYGTPTTWSTPGAITATTTRSRGEATRTATSLKPARITTTRGAA